MNSFLFYILKSTIGICLLYGGFRLFMRKETFFALNRAILLAIVIMATVIPLISLPTVFQSVIIESRNSAAQQFEITTAIPTEQAQTENAIKETTVTPSTPAEKNFSWITLVQYLYWVGISISILILIYGIGSVLILFRKAKTERYDGFKLVIVDHEVSPFSFARILVISRSDYENHQQSILTHELAHIRLNHFFDLALLETIKIAHWFNPFIYLLIRDMKEIHEFQADENTLNSGIDAKQYQFLIIQKGVGKQRFTLANSFNHCQIKKRITMMNKSKTSKAWRWKVATFLPLLALLLMAFGKSGENNSTQAQNQEKNWTEADFGKLDISKFQDKKSDKAWQLLDKVVFFNYKSQVRVNDKVDDWQELDKTVRICFDYYQTDEIYKPSFEKIKINGQEEMAQRLIAVTIFKDDLASAEKYQTLLNFIGNIATEIRQDRAKKIFKTDYFKLSASQKNDIDNLVPAIVKFQAMPQVGKQIDNPPSLYIEQRVEGIFVLPEERPVTIEEMKQKVSTYKKEVGRFVDVRTAAGLNSSETDKIKDALKDEDLSIRYLTFDPVYTMVEKMAEFPGGINSLSDWLSKNVKYPEAAKASGLQGKVYLSIVINSKGKAVFPKIARGLSPALDAEALQIVEKMPTWEPASQRGVPVSVSYVLPINFIIN